MARPSSKHKMNVTHIHGKDRDLKRGDAGGAQRLVRIGNKPCAREGEAPAEPGLFVNHGSAGASPSQPRDLITIRMRQSERTMPAVRALRTRTRVAGAAAHSAGGRIRGRNFSRSASYPTSSIPFSLMTRFSSALHSMSHSAWR